MGSFPFFLEIGVQTFPYKVSLRSLRNFLFVFSSSKDKGRKFLCEPPQYKPIYDPKLLNLTHKSLVVPVSVSLPMRRPNWKTYLLKSQNKTLALNFPPSDWLDLSFHGRLLTKFLPLISHSRMPLGREKGIKLCLIQFTLVFMLKHQMLLCLISYLPSTLLGHVTRTPIKSK